MFFLKVLLVAGALLIVFIGFVALFDWVRNHRDGGLS